MKSLNDFLVEFKKIYEFKIGFVGEISKEQENRLETILQKFGLLELSKGKKTPIQQRPLDFPNHENVEVTYYTIKVKYPTTPEELKQYLGSACSKHVTEIVVWNANDPREEYQEVDSNQVYNTLLTSEYESCDEGQSLVGQNRVMELLKELEKTSKEMSNEYDVS